MKNSIRKESLGKLLEMNGALNKARRFRITYRYYIRPVRKENREGGKPRTS